MTTPPPNTYQHQIKPFVVDGGRVQPAWNLDRFDRSLRRLVAAMPRLWRSVALALALVTFSACELSDDAPSGPDAEPPLPACADVCTPEGRIVCDETGCRCPVGPRDAIEWIACEREPYTLQNDIENPAPDGRSKDFVAQKIFPAGTEFVIDETSEEVGDQTIPMLILRRAKAEHSYAEWTFPRGYETNRRRVEAILAHLEPSEAESVEQLLTRLDVAMRDRRFFRWAIESGNLGRSVIEALITAWKRG